MSEDYHLNDKEQQEMEFTVDMFSFCGCSNQDVVNDIMKVLKELNNDNTSNYITSLVDSLILERRYILLILMCLDREGYIDHGSTIRGSWITPEGKEVLRKWDEIK